MRGRMKKLSEHEEKYWIYNEQLQKNIKPTPKPKQLRYTALDVGLVVVPLFGLLFFFLNLLLG